MDRRQFLKLGAFSALATGGLGSLVASAAGSDYRAAVCVFLAGGCDANNLVVPTDTARYAMYAGARPRLAIPREQLLAIAPASGGSYGLHPQLGALQALFNQQRLAVLANVGTLVKPTTAEQAKSGAWPLPDNLLSHIDQQNQWVMLNPGMPVAVTGWGGRTADLLRPANATARFPATVSAAGSNVFCDGLATGAGVIDPWGSVSFAGAGGSPVDRARMAALTQFAPAAGAPQLDSAYNDALSGALLQDRLLDAAYETTLPVEFPDSYLGLQLYRVAQLIASRGALGMSRQLFYVEQGGYDTHAGQADSLQELLGELSEALGAFAATMLALGVDPNVVTFTHSEFSRTLMAAGDGGDGTDHAWGGHSFVMGGAVRGGDMYGTFPQLQVGGPDDGSDEGRWVPTTSVDQYAATIASWLGVADADLETALPNLANFTVKKLAFL
ncbi:DUF1501 domain-containing protein [Ramlibacter sp. PS4R-6]|uniref:DUF1501 domain-containing protein n=1 Tax=Ramlibacter sp. PS4R-6 TaxID=3133438 RepID=UPI00309E12DF